jgi:hypothetical protein
VTLFQTVFIPICALLAVGVFLRALRNPGSRRSGFFWAFVWLVAAGLITDPSATTTLASWVGIGRGADLVLYVATLAGLGAALFFYARFRRLEVVITGIIRREALHAPRRGDEAVTPPAAS